MLKALEGKKGQERIGLRFWGNPGWSERTREGRKASKSVKRLRRVSPSAEVQRNRDAASARRKEPHRSWGKSLSCAFTWTSDPETSPDKASEGAPKETGDNGKGASGLERGA